MRSIFRSRLPRPTRLPALLQAALFVAALIAAPTLHRYTCSGVCASPKFSTTAAKSCGHCCHDAAPEKPSQTSGGTPSGGCNCLDDCCSWHAVFTTPDAPADAAPATVVIPGPPLRPLDAPRAPGARLLPWPTGPPPGA